MTFYESVKIGIWNYWRQNSRNILSTQAEGIKPRTAEPADAKKEVAN